MLIAIHQPQYLPWSGYFEKIDRSDVFGILDDVQFKKNEWQNRNRIKCADGWQWITVPVLHRFPQRICDVQINNQVDWRRKHLQALEVNYSRAPFFRDFYPFFQDLYKAEWTVLADLNRKIIEFFMDAFGLKREVLYASRMKLREEPTERLIDMCRAAGADAYLAGEGSRNYLDLRLFEEVKIRVEFQAFHPPLYPQLHGSFEPALSAVDLLFNCGPQSLALLQKGRNQE